MKREDDDDDAMTGRRVRRQFAYIDEERNWFELAVS